jgi:hypothetical protein
MKVSTFQWVLIIGLVLVLVFATCKDPAPGPVEPVTPAPAAVSPVPDEDWMSYDEICALMDKWHSELPEITEVFTYGTSTDGKPLKGLRVGVTGKPKVMLHATIHGNEVRSTTGTLWMLQKYLSDYGRDETATQLLLSRDVYWIPVINPDSYPSNRYVDGVDPNRNYDDPTNDRNQVTSIAAIQRFHEQHKFAGVLSGHTWGKDYFYPTLGPSADKQIHRDLGNRMGALSGYSTSQIGSRPAGYDADFYYWKGAVSYVVEFGSNRSTSPSRSMDEGQKNYLAYLLFIEETPTLAQRLSPPAARTELSPLLDPLKERPDENPAEAGNRMGWVEDPDS